MNPKAEILELRFNSKAVFSPKMPENSLLAEKVEQGHSNLKKLNLKIAEKFDFRLKISFNNIF